MTSTYKSTVLTSAVLVIAIITIALASCKKVNVDSSYNILLICIDDLRPELRSFGAAHISSPQIDRLAQSGISFHNHYVNAPSCGPSRYTMLTGRYGPASNQALFRRAKKISEEKEEVHPSMPEWFRGKGYTTVSVGKVSHHPGGRGGADWNDDALIELPNAWDRHLMPVGEWDHPRGAMHGLAHGEIRIKASDMDAFQAVMGEDDIYPDGLITDEALKQIDDLSKNEGQPFFLAVGLLKPHLPFGAPQKYLDLYKGVEFPPIAHPKKPEGKTTWHRSGEFRQYNHWGKDPNEDQAYAEEVRRYYAACVSYADAQVGKILAELKRTGADRNTIVVLWGDHGWHLGEHAIWGKHSLYEESLRSPLIISAPDMNQQNVSTNSIVASIDIFPTLCDLADIETPDFVQGQSLKSIIKDPSKEGHAAFGYTGKAQTVRTATHRMTIHEDGALELYDHMSEEKETTNVASKNMDLTKDLKYKVELKLNGKDGASSIRSVN